MPPRAKVEHLAWAASAARGAGEIYEKIDSFFYLVQLRDFALE